ncbi:MAG: HAD hydrolase-like protein, partial [Williamsia herbipolensis]|nr:HAD hydrolase-like protein [Williamsia herbipolensis]
SLSACGLRVGAEEILSAARLTAEFLGAEYPGRRVWVLNKGPIAEDMSGVEIVDGPDDAPEVIVLGGAGDGFTHDAMSRVLQMMLDGIPVVAMHRSMTWSTDDGIKIDTGVYLEGLEKAAGQSIRAIGKPSPIGFRSAVEVLGMEPTSVVMVGDDLHNDVLGAQASALRGVLVRTGKFRADELDRVLADEFGPVPDHVIDSVADLPDLVASLEI